MPIVRCGQCLGTGQRHGAECPAAKDQNRARIYPALPNCENQYWVPIDQRPVGCRCPARICHVCTGNGSVNRRERYEGNG